MEVIVPAAGLSSRFPGMKPKYLLHDFENKLKLVEEWMQNRPLDLEPYYYLATCYLSLRNYKKFLFYVYSVLKER